MIRSDLQIDKRKWIDLVSPQKEDLKNISLEFNLPLRPLLSCLDPEHLPKYEQNENFHFIILRAFDPHCHQKANAVEDMTTKIALFITDTFVLTIHRLDPEFVTKIRALDQNNLSQLELKEFIRLLVQGAVMSFDEPLNLLEKDALALDTEVFKGQRSGRLLKQGYVLKRKSYSILRVLQLTSDVMVRFSNKPEFNWNDSLDLKERVSRFIFYTEDLVQNINSLLNLHIALSSHRTNEASYRTNEIVRVLTVFSIFFLPLNFIAGIYGMNFEFMPELKHPYGYFFILGFMSFVAASIYIYVHMKGWLNPPEES